MSHAFPRLEYLSSSLTVPRLLNSPQSMESKLTEDISQVIRSSLQLSTFPSFQNLPIELRLKIWSLAINCPRYIHVESELAVPVPGVLHANYESRREALKSYSPIRIPRSPRGQPFNGVVPGKHKEYVNLSRDTVCFFPQATEHDGFYSRITQEDVGGILRFCEDWKVQHFATDLWLWRKLIWSLAYYRSQAVLSGVELDAKHPELSKSSSIRTVTLCRPFESSGGDINRKKLSDWKHDGDLSKGQMKQIASMTVSDYNQLNPQGRWDWEGNLRFGSVKLDVPEH